MPEKTNTLVIMPPTVSARVAQKFRPMEAPANGPPKNLTVLSKNTDANLKAGWTKTDEESRW
jgi:hypothetical protein